MNAGFLSGTNEVIIQCAFFALMLAATEVGFRLGRKYESSMPAETKSQIAIVTAALLGILALLLGFTMSMAVSRFELRRQLVLDEANAIGTSLLRAQLLPAPEGPAIANLLRQYINVRVQYGTSGNDYDIEAKAPANAIPPSLQDSEVRSRIQQIKIKRSQFMLS